MNCVFFFRAAQLDIILDSSSQSESDEERGVGGVSAPPLLPEPGGVGAGAAFSARNSFARTTLRHSC